MSLTINTSKISGVLLPDGWHEVKPGTFAIDTFELGVEVHRADNAAEKEFIVEYNGGLGFRFVTNSGPDDDFIEIKAAPLTSIRAVRYSAV